MKNFVLYGAVLFSVPFLSSAEMLEIDITSGIRSEQPDVPVPARIEVITREQIEDSGASHVADVLRGHNNIQLTDTFGDGSRVNIGMRGFGETANANTLVLVDGRRLNNIDIASPDVNSISLKDIERIEIIQGSSTVLYGDQAVGGVINIITRDIAKSSIKATVGAGSFDSHRLQAEASKHLDNGVAFRLSAEQRHSGGYRDHNELDYENLFALAEYRHSAGRVFAEMQATNEDLNTPGALYLAEVSADPTQARTEYLNDYIDTDTEVFRTGLSHELNTHWKFQGEWTYRESDGDFLQSSRNAPETIPATQDRLVNSLNPRFIGQYDFNGGNLIATVGYDYDDARYRLLSRFGPQNGDQEVDSLYGQLVIPLSEKVDSTLGVRHSWVDNFIEDGFTYPTGIALDDHLAAHEVGLSYRHNQQWRYFARVAENFRFAKVDEYLNPVFGTTTILDNQTGVSYEAGFEYQRNDWQLAMTAYELNLDDEIVFDSTNFGANINLDETRRRGLSIDGTYRFNKATRVNAGLNFIDAEVLSGSFTGSEVPLVADATAYLALHHRINENWRVYGEIYSISDRPYSGDFDNLLGDLDGYEVMNINVSYERNSWTLDMRLNNLLDEEYADFGARSNEYPAPTFTQTPYASVQPSPERNVMFTLSYEFQ